NSIDMTHIFVYGTLKRGQPNHYRMFLTVPTASAEFSGLAACTVQKYPLVIATQHNIPFLGSIPGDGHRVQGEIYKVDDQMLNFLDDFEQCTRGARSLVEVMEVAKDLKAGSTAEAVRLQHTDPTSPDWPSLPTYENYDARGAHRLEYVPREAR
uniref:Gamma-glutamylaminecyclotransferase n=1 Tax=Tetraodon nigroviridis TaxID=99883 RepID=H3C181_TETNG